ncbi:MULTISPECIES: hypothetical protein [unclassified Mycolicibacterium]|uniref:hypothetical protein n=1 Tax=unclassified Mycolicibacterium TaxID=2636767 RepID=UPI0012DDC8F2|nr:MULTISPECIES: hypothetical protein [unclassified Mycolicibacterium]MUL48346.1 hypothetical protein [Mycolicibacterium sp. CBMA 360]MUM31707.1 hypothetical protein [Mycolicibacterium sp. CBMA 361]
MPAQDMAVCPPTMMNAASAASGAIERGAMLPANAAVVPTPGSPFDAAAAGYAGVVQTKVASMSASVEYKAPYVYGATQDGVLRTVTNDEQQAQHIRSVSEGAQAGPGAGPGVPPSLVGGTPRVERPVYPLNPNGAMPGPSAGEYAPVSAVSGAAAGPNAGPGVPPSLVGGTPRVERPVYPLNPNGAMPGPSAGEYAPVSFTEPGSSHLEV